MSGGKEAGGVHPYQSQQSQQHAQYVGPYRLEKTLGKGQTGESLADLEVGSGKRAPVPRGGHGMSSSAAEKIAFILASDVSKDRG